MATIHDAFIGAADETTYGTAVAPNKFFEFLSESIEGKYERIESEGLRAAAQTLRSDRFVPNAKGAEGDIEIEVLDKGFEFWLRYMLGSVSTSGTGPIISTATVANMDGKSLTVQLGRPSADGTVFPFTYEGGKVTEWELATEVDGILKATFGLNFSKETIGPGTGAYALATPTYPANAQLFTFQGGAVTIAGTAFDIAEVSIKHESGLKTDRYFMRGASSTVKKEPRLEGLRKIEFEIKGEFESLVQYSRVASASAAGALAAIVCTWTSPQGGVLKVDLPAGRFDEVSASVDGAELIEQELGGVALDPGGVGGPITITYTPAS